MRSRVGRCRNIKKESIFYFISLHLSQLEKCKICCWILLGVEEANCKSFQFVFRNTFLTLQLLITCFSQIEPVHFLSLSSFEMCLKLRIRKI